MISVDRAKTILESYGGHPNAWPEQERYAVQQVLSSSKFLQSLQQEALALDQFMGFTSDKQDSLDSQTIKRCVKQVLDKLPDQKQHEVKRPTTVKHMIGRWGKQCFGYSGPTLLLASFILVVFGLTSNLQYTSPEKPATLSLSDYMDLYVDESDIRNPLFTRDTEELEILAFLEPDIQEDYY